MKRIISVLILTLSISLSAQTVVPIRVMTYNLRFGELASLDSIAAYIRNVNPDVVALQELDCKTTRGLAPHQNGKDFIGTLAYLTGMFGIYGKTIELGSGYYGIGLLSKYPITAYERIMLPNPKPKGEDRALLIASIELSGNKHFTFACAHLDLTPAQRAAQLTTIKARLEQKEGITILAGDFNTTPSEGEIAKYIPNWMDALPQDFSFPSTKPNIKIDYILYPKQQKIKVINSTIDSSIKLSDHLPGIANLELTF